MRIKKGLPHQCDSPFHIQLIDMSSFADVDVWVASWFLDGTPNHNHGYNGPGTVTIWQYSSQGRVPGISGDVDMNIGYKSY